MTQGLLLQKMSAMASSHGSTTSPSLPESSRLWREALGFERLFCAFHDQSGCGRIVFIARCSGPRDVVAIEQALHAVTHQCPLAALCVRQAPSGRYEFHTPGTRPTPDMEFLVVRDADHGASVAAELARECPPRETEPVLRWKVLLSEADDTFQLVALAHHGLFDGFSIAVLVRRCLEVLGGSDVPEWIWPEPAVPQPNWRTFLKHVNTFSRYLLDGVQRIGKRHRIPCESGNQPTCVIRRWTEAETEHLVDACRDSGTTVTAVLGMAGTRAFHKRFGNEVPVVNVEIPINIRRYLPADLAPHSLGLMVVAMRFASNFNQPWDLTQQARGITKMLRDALDAEVPLRMFHSLNRWIPTRVKASARANSACISANSLGQMDFPASPSGVRLMECGWFGNGGTHMPLYSQSAATIDHRLSITGYSAWLAPQKVRELALDVDQILRDFAGIPSSNEVPTATADLVALTV